MYELATFLHYLWQIVTAMKYVDALLYKNHPPSILSQRQKTGWKKKKKKNWVGLEFQKEKMRTELEHNGFITIQHSLYQYPINTPRLE